MSGKEGRARQATGAGTGRAPLRCVALALGRNRPVVNRRLGWGRGGTGERLMREAQRILLDAQPGSPAAERSTHAPGPTRAKDKSLLASLALSKLYLVAARTPLVIFGCAAVAWGLYALPVFARQVPIERVATHVLAGDPFKAGVLAALMPQIEAAERTEPCSPAVIRSAAIIRTRIAEQAIIEGDEIDTQLNALRGSIHRSLAFSPADPFLWVVLYWVEINRNGFQPDHLKYLRLSYKLGPDEGWIAIKRNGYALAIFHQLPPDIADMALAEFPRLLDSGFYGETIAILTGPGWRERDILLPRLKDVAERHRQAFDRALYKLGYDVTVPGVTRRDPRPWD